MRSFIRFQVIAAILLMASMANAQQVLGSFPTMDGGFEGQASSGALTSATIATGATTTVWTTSSASLATFQTSSPRTGNRYVNFNSASTSKRLQSPTTTVSGAVGGAGAVLNSTQYTVQYYYRTAGATAPGGTPQIGVNPDGTSFSLTYVAVTLNATNGAWQKVAAQHTPGAASNTPRYGVGIARFNTAMTAAVDIDDFVVYAGTTDVTAPDTASTPSISAVSSNSLTVNWSAPGTGVDGGGYMVVRYSDTTGQANPNVNGIYGVGQTIGTGTIVALTTSTNFVDNGRSASTTYYYRVYTVDKAFNYSAPVATHATTGAPPAPASEPTVQASSVTIGTVTSTGFTITWTSGNGSNRLVLIKLNSAVDAAPSDQATYTANTVYSSGDQIGSGNYVVYNGTGNSVTVSGLTKGSFYFVKVFEFNGSSATENYLTTGAPTGSEMAAGSISAQATGLWSATGTWAGGVVPTSGDNVTIPSPYTVTADAATQSCAKLTIDNGASLISNGSNVTSGNQKTVKVYGNAIVANGAAGDGTGSDGLRIDLFNSSTTTTISGTGSFKVSKLLPGVVVPEIKISRDITLTYQASASSPGAGWQFTNTSAVYSLTTIDNGVTLTFGPYTNFSTTSSTSTDAPLSWLCNLNGTITTGANGSVNLRTDASHYGVFKINSGGVMNVNNTFNPAGTADSSTIVVDGTLNLGPATADFSNALQVITGSGSVVLPSGGTISVGAADGLNSTTGPIRTTTRSFNTAANYTFSGTSAQTTGADMPATVNNLTVNNAAGVTLSASTTVSNALNLTSGLLTLGSNNLVLETAATVGGTPSASAMVVATGSGVIQKNYSATGSFTFPVGDNTGTAEYSPASINVTAAGGFSSAYVGVKLFNAKESNNTSSSNYINRYWTVSSSGITTPTYTATFTYLPADVVGSEVGLSGGKYDGSWMDLGAVNTVTHTITGTDLTTFSNFTAGEAAAVPVELSSLTVVAGHSAAELRWNTATEQNNAGFEVEKNINNSWTKIGFVEGHGTTNAPQSYTFTDASAKGSVAYRLKQMDRNGAFKYSGIVEATVALTAEDYALSQNFPNPFNPNTMVSFAVQERQPVNVTVYNALGQAVETLFNGVAEPNQLYTVSFNGAQLSSGTYFYALRSKDRHEVRKMLLTK